MNLTMTKPIATLALLAAFSAAAVAQPAQVAPAPGVQSPAERAENWQQKRQQRLIQRMEQFKQVLQITPAQEGAWSTWVNALAPAQRLQRPNKVEFARMTTPQRIDAVQALRAQRAAQLDRRFAATKAFYAALSAEQKQTFDERGLRFAGAGRAGAGRHHGHHGATHR